MGDPPGGLPGSIQRSSGSMEYMSPKCMLTIFNSTSQGGRLALPVAVIHGGTSLHDQRLLHVPGWDRKEGGPSLVLGARRRAVASLHNQCRLPFVPDWDRKEGGPFPVLGAWRCAIASLNVVSLSSLTGTERRGYHFPFKVPGVVPSPRSIINVVSLSSLSGTERRGVHFPS